MLPMEMSDRCSLVFAAACGMLALKSIKYCYSSAAEETLFEDFALFSDLSFQLVLHVLLNFEQTPVEAGCLVAYKCCLSS